MSDIIPFPAEPHNANIFDGATASFMDDVIHASLQMPVIVDFWATWCGPCKTLTPLLEKHVAAQGGKVRMVKIDIDKNQQLAAQFRIQSVPTVFAFFQGQPVDAFQGALPESQLKTFIERLAKLAPANSADMDLKALQERAAAAFAAGDLDTAELDYADIINVAPPDSAESAAAQIGLLRVQLQRGHATTVRQVMADLPADVAKHKDYAALLSALELAEQGAAAGPADELQQALAKNPDDHEKRFHLAQALFARGDVEDALDHLFEILQRERSWNDEAARHQILKICETIGLEDSRARAARRRLSAIIFK